MQGRSGEAEELLKGAKVKESSEGEEHSPFFYAFPFACSSPFGKFFSFS